MGGVVRTGSSVRLARDTVCCCAFESFCCIAGIISAQPSVAIRLPSDAVNSPGLAVLSFCRASPFLTVLLSASLISADLSAGRLVLHLHHFLRLFRWTVSDRDGTADSSCVHFACADSTPNFIGHLASVDCCFSLHRTGSVFSVERRNVLMRFACARQLHHDHFGIGLSDSTSSTGDIIRALGFRAASLVAGLHIAEVSISVVLRVVDEFLDLRGCHRAAEHMPLLSIPWFKRCTQLVPRSCCHGDGSALPSVWTLLAAVVVAGRSLFVLEE